MNKIWTLGLSLAIALFSCTDPDLIGLEIQPQSDIITISTLENNGAFISLSSIKVDSVKSDENPLNLLGEYTDPVFGDVKASFSTQLLLSESAVDFGDNPTLTSAVLHLTYAGYYGDSTQEMLIEVVELDESIFIDSSYYSNQMIDATNHLASHMFYPYESDQDTLEKYSLQIPLDVLGQKVLDATSDDLVDNTTFLEYFKGIQIRTTDISGSVVYFKLDDVDSRFEIIYNDTLEFDLVMGSGAARLNHFSQAHQLIDELAVQSMGGYNLKIQLDTNLVSSLQDLLAEKPINKATLTFQQANATQQLKAHASLLLVRVDSTGRKVFLTDFYEGEEHIGGELENNQYVFNISKYLSQLISDEMPVQDLYLMPILKNEFYLLPTGASLNANRTLFTGDVELNITYTEF